MEPIPQQIIEQTTTTPSETYNEALLGIVHDMNADPLPTVDNMIRSAVEAYDQRVDTARNADPVYYESNNGLF